MSRSFSKASSPTPPEPPGRDAGFTLLEVLTAMVITILAFATVHFTMGTAVLGKLLASKRVANNQEGRLVVGWIADRARQAGFGTSGSTIARCQDKIATVSPYLPTFSSLYVNADVDNNGTPETMGFQIETVSGVNVVTEKVIDCVTGAAALDQPLMSPTSAQAASLSFAYYDASGNAVTNLTSPAAIRTIRFISVAVQVWASGGTTGGIYQTWSSIIELRNP